MRTFWYLSAIGALISLLALKPAVETCDKVLDRAHTVFEQEGLVYSGGRAVDNGVLFYWEGEDETRVVSFVVGAVLRSASTSRRDGVCQTEANTLANYYSMVIPHKT